MEKDFLSLLGFSKYLVFLHKVKHAHESSSMDPDAECFDDEGSFLVFDDTFGEEDS